MFSGIRAAALAMASCLPTACDAPPPPPGAAASSQPAVAVPWFRDATAPSGLTFVHEAGPTGTYFFPQIMGSGAALFDCDNDGRLDVYLLHNAGPASGSTNRLFRQQPDGTFTDASDGSGLDVASYGMGAAVGDVNNDSLADVLLTEYGRARLFLNRGGARYEDVSREAGVENPLWGTSAAFVDYDRDGWLDLVIVNYVAYDVDRDCTNALGRHDYCSPKTFKGTAAKLFRNLGPAAAATGAAAAPNSAAERGAVRFKDVTLESGLAQSPGPGLGVVCGDFNGDRWPDLFVANDGAPNHLWVNRRDGTFSEEAVLRGVAFNATGGAEANMGVAIGDADGDGHMDLFVTHLADEVHRLWSGRSGGAGLFRDTTLGAGLAASRWRGTGFGTVLTDFTHAGAPHLAIVNGAVTRGPAGATAPGVAPFWAGYAQRNQLFVNDGAGRFRDVSEANPDFCGAAGVGRGLACGDVDGDGDLDLLATAVAGPAKLLHNVAPKAGHWLGVRVVDPALGGRDAYGAEVVVRAGGRRWVRWVNPGYSYLVSNDPRAHFGLGPQDRADSVSVVWPDGTEEQFAGGPCDRYVTLRRGEGRPVPNPATSPARDPGHGPGAS